MNEDTKPTATRVGTLELALELKDLPAVLAGLEQIAVAAREAAAAVASIGHASMSPGALRVPLRGSQLHSVVGTTQPFELNGQPQIHTP